VRLPETFFCYAPPPEAPAVGSLPFDSNGFVTFGCQNNLAKVTPRTIALWSAILRAVPDSRFALLAPASREVDDRVLSAFESHGVERRRIELVRRATPAEYLQRYNRIDIALDPVPFNGHTTTCDAAWMGCPTVSLSGEIYAHRYGGSVLRNVGLHDLVANNDEAYVTIATSLAADVQRLSGIRFGLRDSMSSSIITDGARFTRNLERAYRQIWREWCGS
jgi:protein O-GlcNAc transferase